jgi:hypothetical protein
VVDRAARPDYKPPLPAETRLGRAQVAQLVEHATENRSVGGSIPPLGTITFYPQVGSGSVRSVLLNVVVCTEAQLGRQHEDEVRRVYNHAKCWLERVRLMTAWPISWMSFARSPRLSRTSIRNWNGRQNSSSEISSVSARSF